jgi:hypothetical protein
MIIYIAVNIKAEDHNIQETKNIWQEQKSNLEENKYENEIDIYTEKENNHFKSNRL